MNCTVYCATSMTGKEKTVIVARARQVCNALVQRGLKPISPVLEEKVDQMGDGKLYNSLSDLAVFWRRDKDIIRNEAHVILLDGADEGSIGMAREYALSRYCLWKPTVILHNKMRSPSVADFEDDFITYSIGDAADLIKTRWGTRSKRFVWRVKMLYRSLPQWLIYQIKAWR